MDISIPMIRHYVYFPIRAYLKNKLIILTNEVTNISELRFVVHCFVKLLRKYGHGARAKFKRKKQTKHKKLERINQ